MTSEWWLWLWALGVTEIEVLGPNWSLLAVTALRASGLVIGLVVAGLSGRALCRGPPARPTSPKRSARSAEKPTQQFETSSGDDSWQAPDGF